MRYTKEKIALGIFIVSILALIILMPFAFFQSRTTGKAVETVGGVEKVEKTTGEITCSDSDSGRNYYIKGVVDYCDSNGCSSKEDSCSGKKLIERYCENNKENYEEHNCEFDCDNGVCVNLVTKYKYTGGGGGGGGSGGGTTTTSTSAATESYQTYDFGALASEHHIDILKNDNIKLSISGTEYTLTLSDNTETQVTITNTNDGQTYTLNVGSDRNIDLNSDGISEIYIKIESVNTITNKVKLILRAA